MNTTPETMSREAFEKWYKNEYPGADVNHPTGAPVYSWRAWQGAHLSAPTPLPTVGDEVERVANALLDEVARQPGHAYLDDPLTMVELDGQFSFIDLARTAIAALRPTHPTAAQHYKAKETFIKDDLTFPLQPIEQQKEV